MRIEPGSRFPLLAPALLAGLALGWGLTWPIMKLALADIPPWTFRGWSTLVAGLSLLSLVRLYSGRLEVPPPEEWRSLALAAIFNVTAWNLLVANGLLMVASGKAALLAYTMPLWSMVIGRVVLGEAITRRSALALALGLAGIFTLLQPDIETFGDAPLGSALCLGAAVSWAIGALIQKRRTTSISVLAVTGWQLILGALPILALLPVIEGVHFPQAGFVAWLAAAWATFIGLALCYFLWFQIVKLLPMQAASLSVLMVPIVGVAGGSIILDEPFGTREMLAIGFIGCALALVMLAPAARKRPA